MDVDFTLSPNKEAVGMLEGKKPVASNVFYNLLPEMRGRAFTIAGIEGANVLQAARDAIAAIPQGELTWDEAKEQIAEDLEPYLGEDGSQARAEVVLRVNAYQAFSSSLYKTAQADDDTTHLQYLHGECLVPTPSHLALNGIILPKDDPFWDTHTGPWGHLGCVCYFRPMNEDLVADQKDEDEKRAPDARLVMEGPALRALQHGDVIRDGQHFNIAPNGPENSGFSWHPGDLRIPVAELKSRYDADVFQTFENYCKNNFVSPGTTVWNWLNGVVIKRSRDETMRQDKMTISKMVERLPAAEPSFSGPALPRLEADEAKREMGRDFEIQSKAGFTVRFGKIVRGHFEKTLKENPNDPRARYLPAAKATVQNPIEVWENNHRHYYIARFRRPGSSHSGFVVVAARIGEMADEAITFFPKTENELKKFQLGRLIYQKK